MIAANHMTSRRTPSPTCPAAINGYAEAVDRWHLPHALRVAIVAGALSLRYRPRLCLATGEVVANEAFIHWPDRKQDLIPSGASIQVAERGDVIGAWMLAEGCKEAAHWNAARLSVNVSARQLQSGVLPIQLATVLEQSGLPPDRLELELTGSLLVGSSNDTLLALSAIRDLGIGLALGDFGAGFASLSMLKRLPLTAMKLNRLLVRALPMSREGATIVHAAVEAGRAMRLTTVADGIETEAQRAFLAGVGCDEGQGDLFSHPLPAWQLCPELGLARS